MVNFIKLEVRRMLRDRRYLIFNLGITVAFYLLYTKISPSTDAIDGTSRSAYFMVSMAAYGAMGSALFFGGPRIAMERKLGWTRQLRVTPLSPTDYVIGKLAAAMIVPLPSICLISLAGAVVNGVSLSAAQWLGIIAITWLGTLPFAVLGIFIGSLLDGNTAQPVTTFLMFGLAILGGLWAPVSSMPSLMERAAKLMPSYHFADPGWRIVGQRGLNPVDFLVILAYAVLFGALVAWRYRQTESWRDA